MKKFLKLFTCALTLMAGTGVALANPTTNFVNAIADVDVANSQGSFSFTVKKMVSNVDAKQDTNKDKFFIPFPEVTDGASNVKVNVKVGSNTYEYVVDQNVVEDNYFKKATINGVEGVVFKYTSNITHQVYFTADMVSGEDTKTYASSIFSVVIKGVTYSYDIEDLETAVPTIAGKGDKIYIPTLKVLDVNGADQGVAVNPVVTKNGVEVELTEEDGKYYLTPSSYGTYTISYNSTTHRLSDYVDINVTSTFDSSKAELVATTLGMDGVELGEVAHLTKPIVNDTYNNIDEIQTNVKISIYDNEDNLVKTLKENSFDVIFNKAGSYKVKYEISNMYLNNKKTINLDMSEELVVSDTTSATVNFVENYTVSDDTTEKATVVDLAETQTESTSWEDSVVVLNDSVLPTRVGYNEMVFPAIYASDLGVAYENMEFERTIVYANKIYNIDSKEDNAKLQEDSNKYNESIAFEFTRLEDEIIAEGSDGVDENATYSNRIARTYTLVYKVIDKTTGKEIGRKETEFTVLPLDVDYKTDNTNLTISLPNNIQDEMTSDEVVSVNMNKTSYGASIKDDEDERIETHYYYYYGEKSVIDGAFDYIKGENGYAVDFEGAVSSLKAEFDVDLYELAHENNVFDIKLGEEYDSQTTFTVVAVAINDQGQFVIDSKQMTVIDTTNDFNPPTITVDSEFDKSVYTLGEDMEVALPMVTFEDDQDRKLAVSVKYYIDSIENGLTAVSGGGKIETDTSVSLVGKYVAPERAGTYYVVYTATDNANNSYDFVTSFVVEEEATYSIKLEYKSSVNIYEKFDIIASVVDADGNVVEDYQAIVDFPGKNPDYEEGTTVQFNTAGEYNFTVITDAPGATEIHGVITVSDVAYVWENEKAISVPTSSAISSVLEYSKLTSKPSDWDVEEGYKNYFVKDGDNYVENTTAEWTTDTFYKYNPKVYVEFDLPKAYRTGLLDTLGTEYATVKVTDPDSDEVDVIYITDNVEDWRAKFEAKEEGKYTVKFSIGSLSKTFYVQVGDNEKPVVQITDKTKLQKDVVMSEDEISYKLTYVLNEDKSTSEQNVYNITVAIGDKISYQSELVLYDLDRNGKRVALDWKTAIKNSDITLNKETCEDTESADGKYSYIWTIDKVGDYELKINATDVNGVEAIAETVKFTVTDDVDVTTKKDNKVGIILIVVSAIVLAGIACFFAFSGKKSGSVKRVKETTDKKEDKE